ncbi:hypothetical protein K7432_008903 [Basidiobolus ranarum]|uniref:Uncharacterized protein n=1 Tax=Basidiobolus ranarum TaxID=34480 RepID=A0ABR2VXV5_9FUNG
MASPSGEKVNLRVGTASTDDESSLISQHSLNADLPSNTPSYSSLIPDTNVANEDGDLYRTDLNNNYTSISLPNKIEETNGMDSNRITSTDEPVFNSQTRSLPPSSLHHERSNSVSSEHSTSSLEDMDGIGENWWSKQGLGVLSHWFDSPITDSGKKKQGQNRTSILDIPIQFIALLTYPEIDPVSRKKLTYSDLKEIGRVKNRRKVLLFLTIYSFVVRWCSFDLFLVVLFSANCGILFLMKNSGKVNMQMAKRTVRQRANYMKQWAGGLFKKNSNNGYPGPPQYYPNSSSVQANKVLTKAATDVSSESAKHKKFFSKKNHSLMDAGKTDEVKTKKKLFPRSSSKATSASVPISLPNNSEPELNKLGHNGRLMSIDNSSF